MLGVSVASPIRRRKSVPNRAATRDDILPGIFFRVTGRVTLLSSSGLASRNSVSQISGEEWDWRATVTETLAKKRPERVRPRSYSLTDRLPSITTSLIAPVYQEQSDSDDELLASPNVGFAIKRRASIAAGPPTSGISVYSGSLAHLVPNSFLQTTSRRVSTHGTALGCSCSSCNSTVTPYWRDGWAPNVMLCNACGLRFQKFARRCPTCMYIPRKEDSLGDRCVKCSTLWIVGPSSC